MLVPIVLAAALHSPAACAEEVFDIRIENRSVPVTGDTVRVSEGDLVVLRWHTDEPVTLHLHGYDIEIRALPDRSVETRLETFASGRFPITSHGFGDADGHGHRTLMYLEVLPR